MKRIILSLFALVPMVTFAQTNKVDKGWQIHGVTGLNVSQTSLSNWAAGGENNMSGNIYINGTANYQKDNWVWTNTLSTDFGRTYSKSLKWQTVVDKFDLSSKIGYKVYEHLNISALGDFLTQFTPGYKSASAKNSGEPYISNFMAPAYLNLAIGADYRPNKYFSLLVSPITGKMTFVCDNRLSAQGAYGVKPGNKSLQELGASIVGTYNAPLYDNISINTKLTLFTAYNHDFGDVDVYWDVMLAAKINSFLSATLTTNLVYDNDIKTMNEKGVVIAGPKVQFREILGIGLAYTF